MIPVVLIAEPMTFATDLLVALIATLCARSLWRQESEPRSTARGYWAAALLSLAVAALAGGFAHALAKVSPGWLDFALWRTVFFAMGLASYAMVVGTAYATTRLALRTPLLIVAVVGFAAYALRARSEDDFRTVVLGYSAALVLVAGMAAVSLLRQQQPVAMRWWLAGVVITALASIVQQSGFSLHRHFNHNDLYHVIGALAVLAFFAGARAAHDASRPRRYQEESSVTSSSIGETDSASPPEREVDSQTSV